MLNRVWRVEEIFVKREIVAIKDEKMQEILIFMSISS